MAGDFFDVEPSLPATKPPTKGGIYKTWLRFSFGPSEDNMLQGLARLKALVADARAGKVTMPKSS